MLSSARTTETIGMKLGDAVRLRRDPTQVGTLVETGINFGGREYVSLELNGGGKRRVPFIEIEPVAETVSAIEDLRRARISSPERMAEILRHTHLSGRLADVIYSMETTNTEFHAYQFKPLVKLLNAESRGLLIADEVGLGKTIEAGLIWTELVARFDARRLLVVAPKSLQLKWKRELQSKFSITAKLADASELLETFEEAERSDRPFAVVTSLSGLRPPKGWEAEELTNARARLARYLRDNANEESLLDLVIFDEAHHLRNPESQQHKGARLICGVSDYRALLSATPINLKNADLRVLLTFLDPDLFEKEWVFDQLREDSRPIVRARNLALDSSVSFTEVIRAVKELPRSELAQRDRRAGILSSQSLSVAKKRQPAFRAELAARLEQMSLLGGFINRTRRRDVVDRKVKRRASVQRWAMSEYERRFYDEASDVIRNYAWELDVSDRFLLSMPQRLMASSLPAAARHWIARNAVIQEDGGDERKQPSPLVALLGEVCRDPTLVKRLEAKDTKFEHLAALIEHCSVEFPDEKLIVFSTFRRTIDYLDERLARLGVETFAMHGSSETDRDEIVDQFRDAGGACVLLSSEIGAEGIDLQFARIVINYDLPWNPMRVEQRIGRVDRIGQKSDAIAVFSLISEDTIEERIYDRLYDRLNLIEESLGSFEAILGPIIADFEKRWLDPRLSRKELADELERAAIAAENKRNEEERLSEDAEGLLAHGDFILNSIQAAHDNGQWITPEKLAAYIHEAVSTAYPGSKLERAPTKTELYDLRMTHEAHLAFLNFLETNHRGVQTRLRRYTGQARLLLAKRPERWRDTETEFVSVSHPLTRFAATLREAAVSRQQVSPAIAVRIARSTAEPLLGAALGHPGRYTFAIARWEATIGDTLQQKIVKRGLSLETGDLLGESACDQLIAASLNERAGPLDLSCHEAAPVAERISRDLIDGVLAEEERQFLEYQAATFEDRQATRLSVLTRQRDQQVQRFNDEICRLEAAEKRRTIPMRQGKRDKYLARMNARIDAVKSRYFTAKEQEIIAIGLVEVFNG